MRIPHSFRKWIFIAGCSTLSAVGCASKPGGLLSQLKNRNPTPAISDAEASEHYQRKEVDAEKLHLQWAKLQESNGNLDEARKSFERVLEQDSRSLDALLGMARIDHLSGRTYEAEQGYQKLLKQKPGDPRVLDAAGQFYAAEQRWNESIELLQQATQNSPSSATYRYHLAVALAESGNLDAAFPHFAKTVGDAEAHYNVGYILYKHGQLAEAEEHFLQAILKRPQLEVAQEMYDEVRAERENLQLAGGTSDSPSTLEARRNTPQPGPSSATHAQQFANSTSTNARASATANGNGPSPRASQGNSQNRLGADSQPANPFDAIATPSEFGNADRIHQVGANQQPGENNSSGADYSSSERVGRRMPVKPPAWPGAGRAQPGSDTTADSHTRSSHSRTQTPPAWSDRQRPIDFSGAEPDLDASSNFLTPAQLEQLRNQSRE